MQTMPLARPAVNAQNTQRLLRLPLGKRVDQREVRASQNHAASPMSLSMNSSFSGNPCCRPCHDQWQGFPTSSTPEIIKGKKRSPSMRHVSRTHRGALDWLFDRLNLDHQIQIKYIDTKNQLADILTKGHFTRDEWNHLLCLFNISPFQFHQQCQSDVEKKRKKIQVKKESQQNRSR